MKFKSIQAKSKQYMRGVLMLAGLLGLGASSSFGQYSSSVTSQNTANAFPGMNNAMIIELDIVTTGGSSVLQTVNFNTNGTSATSNIENAKLYYNNGGSFTTPLAGSMQVGSTITSPSGTFSFTGLSVNLTNGTNRFFLTYDVPYNASLSEDLDAECTSIQVDGNSETPSITSPLGVREVLANSAYNYCAYPATNIANYQIGISRLQVGDDQIITNTIAIAGTVQTTASPEIDLVKDVTYDFNYNGGSGNPQQERIYMDVDNDGFFESNELLFTGNTPASTRTYGSLNVDCGLESGLHRIRIATDLGTPSGPCGPNGFGTAFEVIANVQDAAQPTADFSIPDTVYRGAYVDMINESSGLGYSYAWDYDNDNNVDDNTTDGRTQYNTSGSYTIKLSMTRSSCGNTLSDDVTKQIIVIDPTGVPASEFIANRNVTNQTLTVSFKDLSNNGANAWHWKITPELINGFPGFYYVNGTDSNSQNPQIQFLQLGTYNVEFYSENVLGSGNYVSKPEYIRCIEIVDFCAVTTTTDENGFIADEGGVFSNYPNYAGTGNLCGFLIQPNCASTITFNFLDFDMSSYQVTNCNIPGSNPPVLQPFDHVKIFDGTDNTGIPLHVQAGFPNGFSNGPANTPLAQLPPTVTASSGSMYIEYSVNCAFNGRGFLGEWSSTPQSLPAPTAAFDGPDTVYTDAPYIFTNTSSGEYDIAQWDYENDGLNDITADDVEITFTSAGVQTVKLTVSRCGNADVYTKDITVIAPSSAPVVDFEATREAGIVFDTLRFLDKSAEGPNAFKWTITPAADISFVNGSSSTSRNPFVKFNKTGQYTVKLYASNSLGADSLVKTNYIGIYTYCTPNVVNLSSDIGISRFSMGSIDNSSSIGVSNYTLYDLVTSVQQGQTYDFEIERNSDFNNVNYKIWIDFNKNGSFTDPGEEIYSTGSTAGLVHAAQLRIPKNAPVGNSRIRIGASAESNFNLSCGPNQFGEFEDYMLLIEEDDTKPVLSINGASPFFMEQGYAFVDPGATATDNADGNINHLIQINTNLDTSVVGEYWWSYHVTDSSGNKADSATRIIIVEKDGSGPVISLSGGDTIIHPVGTTWTDPGSSATDFVDGVIGLVNVSGSVNEMLLGTYYLTYSATDLQDNTNTVQRVVKVVDNMAPGLSLIGSDPLVLDYGQPFADPGVTISDNYYNDLVYTSTGVVNNTSIGSYLVTYYSTDPSGNAATPITRTVEVKDVSAPKIDLYGADTVVLDVFDKFVDPGSSVSDNHTKGLTATVTGSVNNYVLGNYTLTYEATDSTGNTASMARLVMVVDREAPVITLKGASFIQMNRFDNVPDPGVRISDNYDSEVDLQNNLVIMDSVKTDWEGLYQYCYQVEDNSGNKSAQVCRLVNVGPADPNGINTPAQADLNLYPNPTSTGAFTINWAAEKGSIQHVSLYNAQGALVYNKSVHGSAQQVDLDISHLTPGIYYVSITVGDKTYRKKLTYFN